MAKVAVVVTCYNAFPILKQCLDALFSKSSPNVSAVLVDNHSPSQQTRDYLHSGKLPAAFRDVVVLDPGRNLGSHNGWNFGFEHGVMDSRFDYVVKLDDDTVITTQDWDTLMVSGLEHKPAIAFLSADGTYEAKQLDTWSIEAAGDLVYEIPPRNIVDFHCVMFRVPEMLKWERPSRKVKGNDQPRRRWRQAPIRRRRTLHGAEGAGGRAQDRLLPERLLQPPRRERPLPGLSALEVCLRHLSLD